jgi:S1-C subfamily serine protease
MPPGSTCVRKALALAAFVVAAAVLAGDRAFAADDASAGYQTIRPSLVKVWAFDAAGRPIASGTGVIVTSSARRSEVLTAAHVVAGAASLRIDVSRDLHDLSARIERAGPRDLTLLAVDRGDLTPARFAPASRAVVEGNLVAIAGYVKNDELIGVAGQEPRVLFPGTVSSRPDGGKYLELENVHVEEGLSGGPVFDPVSGEILGIVTSRTTDARGGFADSGALVVLPFLDANRAVAAAVTPPPAAPIPPPAAPLPPPPATPSPVLPVSMAGDIVSWQAGASAPKRFAYVRDGCTTAVVLEVRTLQFVVAHRALVPPHRPGALLAVALSSRMLPGIACSSLASTQVERGAYEPTVMSFDGRHVTMRFVFAGDPADADLFPSDASLDADLGVDGATATLQFFDREWNGSIDVPLARTALASVSAGW